MRRSYVVPMRWMVIYEYEVPGGALNLSCTKLPRPWSPRGSSPSRKNFHGRTGNRTRDLMISSQKLWPLDHEVGQFVRNTGFIWTLTCISANLWSKLLSHGAKQYNSLKVFLGGFCYVSCYFVVCSYLLLKQLIFRARHWRCREVFTAFEWLI
jgi:hypothetical protein